MSTNALSSYYTLIHNALPSHTGHSVVVYTSTDRVFFDAHPSPIHGSNSIIDLSTVLHDLNTTFVLQVSNHYIKRAIDLAPYPQRNVDLDPGLSVRVVDDARDLAHLQHYEAVFIRRDGSLVMWGDDEGATLGFWIEIIGRLQSQSGNAIPTTTPVAGLPGNDGINPEDTILWGDTSLPYLDEFLHLFTFADYMPPRGADPQGYYEASTYTSWQRMTSAGPEGSLGFALPQRAPSPFSDGTTTSSLVNSPSTVDLEGVFPSYTPSVYVGEEEEVAVGSNISLDFSLSIDRGVSPALSGSQCTVRIPGSTPPVPEQASSSSSSPQHSVVETSAPGSPTHGIDQNATHEEAGHHVPQPITNANGSASDATTGNADVDLRSTSNTRLLKRRHSDIEAGSSFAPARLTTPLPDVQLEDGKRRRFTVIAPAPPPASASASTSTSTSAPAPTFLPPASGRPPRRPGNRRRGGGTGTGRSARGRRHPCEYCNKTFSRVQDMHRHTETSCNASPHRATVDCPECGAILSRLDAAQRHWRGHENPTCPTPDWVSGRL